MAFQRNLQHFDLFGSPAEPMLAKAMEVLATRHQFNCQIEFPFDHGLRDHVFFDYVLDYASESFRIGMRNYMLEGYKKSDTFHLVPTTWWEHFKETHFPKWVLTKWPVKYDKLPHTSTHLCPHLTNKHPEAKCVRFLYFGPEKGEL